MTPRQQRTLRATVAAAVSTVLAAVSHTIGGGEAPAPLIVAAIAVLVLPVGMLFAARRAALPRITATVIAAQLLFHTAFAALGSPAGVASVSGHQHGPVTLTPVHAHAATLWEGPMLLAHAVAAAVTIAVLWRGEAAVRQVASWAAARLRRWAMPLPGPRRRIVIAATHVRLRPVDSGRLRVVPLRGPPAW